MQRLYEALSQLREIEQRTSEEGYAPSYRFSAGKPAYGLIYNGLENRGCHIRLFSAVVEQRLDIALCENSAPRRYRIYSLAVLGKLVEPGYIGVQKRRHLIYESARSARARAVHSLLYAAAQIGDLSVLAAQLYGYICLGDERFDSDSTRLDLLYKRYIQPFCRVYAARTGNGYAHLFVSDLFKSAGKHPRQRFLYVGIMSLIVFIDEVVFAVDNGDLYRCRADIKSDMKHSYLSFLKNSSGLFRAAGCAV